MRPLSDIRLTCPVCGDTAVRVKGSESDPQFYKHEDRRRRYSGKPCEASGADASMALAAYRAREAKTDATWKVEVRDRELRYARERIEAARRRHVDEIVACEAAIVDAERALDEARRTLATLTEGEVTR